MIARIWAAMMKSAGVRTWAIIGAGVILTGVDLVKVWITWKGPWPLSAASQQLDIIGWSLWADQLINAIIIIALTGIAVAASVSKTGVNLNVGEDEHPVATVTTTTETTVATEPK